MKAVALTDHGNMFGAVAFHDACDSAGVKPILGCEIYVAPGSRHEQRGDGDRGGLQPPHAPRLRRRGLPQPREAGLHRLHRGLLPPPPDRQGRAGEAQRGAHRPLGLPLGRGRRPHPRRERGGGAAFGGRVQRDLRQGPLLPRGDGPRDRGAAAGEPGARSASTERTGLPLVATNDAHYLRKDDHQAHDVLLCIGSGKKVHETGAAAVRHAGVLREERGGDGGRVPRPSRSALEHGEDRGDVRLHPQAGGSLPAFDVPAGFTIESYFEKVARDGYAERLRALEPLAAAGRLRHPIADYESRLEKEIGVIRRVGLRRVLPHRLGLHPLRPRARNPRGTGTRLGRGQPRRLLRCASPTSTPSRTTSSSSASSTRSAPRPPTSTSTSARTAAARSSSTSRASTAARTWPRSSPSGP